ncbi:hypothetical protein ACFFR8_25815 [Streptoalloteichus tenebrarius]
MTTPVSGFSGEVAGIVFVDGHAETSDRAALVYFRSQGYGVTEVKPARKTKTAPAEPATPTASTEEVS